MKHPAPPIGTLQPDRLLWLGWVGCHGKFHQRKKPEPPKPARANYVLRMVCGFSHTATIIETLPRNSDPRAQLFFFFACLLCSACRSFLISLPDGASPPETCISRRTVCVYIANPRTDPHGSAVMARPVARPSPSPSPQPSYQSAPSKSRDIGCGDSSRSNNNSNNKTPRWHSLHQQRHTHLPRQQSACPLRVWLVDPIASPATPSPASPLSLDYRIVQRPPGCLSISRRPASGSRFPAMPTEKGRLVRI